ncbi:MAG: hypothetical protein R3C19_05780 [Planctomycetaceae bacterium]
MATSGLSPKGVAFGLDQFKLRAEEKLILDAIRIVEPRIKAIATVGEASRHVGEGSRGIIVGLEDADEPVPIGSLGDGVWRLLGLALHFLARGQFFSR